MPDQVNRRLNPRRASFPLFAGLGLAAAVAAMAASGVAHAAAPPEPDLILFHGRILTVDPHDSVVQGVAIRDGKIIAAGSDRDMLRLAGPATRRIHLEGRAAAPGVHDN